MAQKIFFEKLIKNYPAKIISITAAIFVVMFHRMNMTQERFFSAPLSTTENGNMLPAIAPPSTVRIALRGDTDTIYPIVETDVEAYLDLTRYNAKGTYRVPVQIRRKGTALLADSLEIRVEPTEISLDIDQKQSKYIKVKENVTGTVAQGYSLASIFFKPEEVLIDGPAVLLEKINAIGAKEIDLNGRTDDFVQSVGLLLDDPLLKLVKLHGEPVVELHALVRPVVVTKLIETTVEVRNLPEAFSAELSVEKLQGTLQGNEIAIGEVEKRAALMYVYCSELDDEGEYTLPVLFDLPDGVTLVDTSADTQPPELVVKVTKKKLQ